MCRVLHLPSWRSAVGLLHFAAIILKKIKPTAAETIEMPHDLRHQKDQLPQNACRLP